MEVKEKLLWEVLDTLRGEIAPAGQRKYVLSLMTLKVIEEKQDQFNLSPECMWSEIISSGKDLGTRLDMSFEKLEKDNSGLQNVFRHIEFTQISDATLHKLALQINQLSLNENSGEIADNILSLLAEHEGRKGGEYITPQSISSLIIQLLDVQDGSTVFDPAAGTGQFLNHASSVAEGVSLYGQEMDEQTWAIGKMNAILHGNEEMELRMGDTIRKPQFMHRNGLQTFDYVLMDPPYGLRNWGYEEAQDDIYGRFFYGIPPKSKGDMAFVLHALTSLNEKGKAAIVVPHGVLFRGATEGKIRQKLIEQNEVEAVIGLPSGLLYSSSIPVAILILNKSKERDKGIFFIQAEEQFQQFRTEKELGESNIKKIVDTFKAGKEIERFSKWVRLDEIKDYSLNLQHYFEEDQIESAIGTVQVNKKEFEQNKTIQLREAGSLFRGMNPPTANQLESEQPTHSMIELSHVQEGQILIDKLTPISIDDHRHAERYGLKAGDIILSSRGSAIKIAIIPETDGQPLLLSNHFIGIRPKQDIHPEFLKAFLESPVGMFYLLNNQKGSTVSVLTAKDIQYIPIPNLPYEKQTAIGEGFIESNTAHKRRIQEANEKHQEAYEDLYHEMGLGNVYTKLD